MTTGIKLDATVNTGQQSIHKSKNSTVVNSCETEQSEQTNNSNTRPRVRLSSSDLTASEEIRRKIFGNGRDAFGNLFPLFLPPLESVIDEDNNSLLIGAGNKTEEITFTKTYNVRGGLLVLTFCGYGLLQSVEIIGDKEYGKTNAELGRTSEEETVDVTESLRQLLYAASMDEADFSSNMEVNNNILQMLGRIGIDTNRNFRINNHSFRVNNGAIQSSGVRNS